MEAFYVCIIFLGIILVVVAMFFIIMDKVNGKDFFKEFDRKKDEMFNLIQDSEEMVHELNKMSDYVVTVISEKNQEFFNKNAILNPKETTLEIEEAPKELLDKAKDEQVLLDVQENSDQERLSKGTVLQNTDVENQGVIYQTKDEIFANQGVVYQNRDQKFANQGVVYQNRNVKFENQNKDVKFLNQEVVNQNKELDLDKQENILNTEIVYNTSNDNLTEINKTSDLTFIKNNLSEDTTNKDTTNKDTTNKDTTNKDITNKDITNEASESISKPKLTLSGIRGQVLQMVEKGFTDEEISKRLRVGKGEINLIRGLSK